MSIKQLRCLNILNMLNTKLPDLNSLDNILFEIHLGVEMGIYRMMIEKCITGKLSDIRKFRNALVTELVLSNAL